MDGLKDSLSRKLTAMNMLVSGGALLLASVAFFAYDLATFRDNLVTNTSIQAQIIGANAISALVFNDVQSVETTMSALRASPNIVYAAVYTEKGDFLAGYWRDQAAGPVPLPQFLLNNDQSARFEHGRFDLEHEIIFQGKAVGVVYIESDLRGFSARFRTYGLILLIIVGLSLAAALFLSRLSQRRFAQPILRLAETARRVSRDKDFLVRAQPTRGHDEIALLVDAFNDMLTEIQKRDSALQVSERQFRTLADSIPQLAWIGEINGERTWFNQRWYEYTGSSPEATLGWGWESAHDPKLLPEVRKKWRESIRTGLPFEMLYPLKGIDGTFREFLTRAMPVRDSRGEVVRWFGTNTDITEQRRSEEALRQTEKLAATGRLAASIAHEINNPLEAVTNLVYLARMQPANAQKYLKLADEELDRIAQITKNTLGFYRDTASASAVDISEVLREVIAMYARKLNFKKIELRQDYAKGIVISGFPGEIRQVFANLLANAIEAMSDSGQMRIRTRAAQSGEGDRRRSGVRITFLDNGAGIPPDKIKRIFEPFYTTKKDVGTGLGLWLTLGLVGKHQGSLRVRSSVRPGWTWTAFSLFLPTVPVSNKLSESESNGAPEALSS